MINDFNIFIIIIIIPFRSFTTSTFFFLLVFFFLLIILVPREQLHEKSERQWRNWKKIVQRRQTPLTTQEDTFRDGFAAMKTGGQC